MDRASGGWAGAAVGLSIPVSLLQSASWSNNRPSAKCENGGEGTESLRLEEQP